MELFNVGILELVVIVVIALLVFGPERLPEVARRAARILNQVRGVVNDVQRTFMEETHEIRMPIEEFKREVASVAEPMKEVREQVKAGQKEVRDSLQLVTTLPPTSNGTAPKNSDSTPPYKPLSSSEVNNDPQ